MQSLGQVVSPCEPTPSRFHKSSRAKRGPRTYEIGMRSLPILGYLRSGAWRPVRPPLRTQSRCTTLMCDRVRVTFVMFRPIPLNVAL